MAEPLLNRAWAVALVGRTGARAALRRWDAEAAAGRLRLVAVSGPPGIGKSRLLAWAADEHAQRGGTVRVGRCSPGTSPPFAPLTMAFGARWPVPAVEPGTGGNGSAQGNGAGTADGGGRVPAGSSYDQPELHQVRALADVTTDEAADRPLMLALDDLHWADPGTLGVLEQLVYLLSAPAGAACPVTIVLTHRPLAPDGAAAGTLARLAREPAYRSLPLDPLDEVEVHELIRRLTAEPPDRRLVQRVYEASGGNPLVAIAATDAARSPAGSRRPLAGTVDDVVAGCLQGLSPGARQVALALAINAGTSHPYDLAALCGLDGDACDDALDELDRARLVAVADDRCDLALPHAAEAVLAGATTRERQRAHGRIAGLLRTEGGGRGPDILALAHHLERAGPGHAAELAALAPAAAAQAFAAGTWGWAARLYDVALADLEGVDGPERAAWEEAAGVACMRDFDHAGCERHLGAAIALAGELGDDLLAARAAMSLVRHRFTSGTEAIGRWIDVSPLDRVVDGDLPAGVRAQAHALLAEIGFQADDLARAREHVATARALAAEAGDDYVRFSLAFSDGLAHLGALDVDAAAAAFGEADRCARRSGLEYIRPWGAVRLALAEVIRGDLDAAARRAAGWASESHDAAHWSEHALAETAGTIVATLAGRFDDMEDHGERARVSCGRSANTFTPLVLHPVLAWGRAARGDRDGAEAALADLDASGGRSGRYRAVLDVMAGEHERVRERLDGYAWRTHPPALTAYDAGAHAAELELALYAGNRAEVAADCALLEDVHRRGGRFLLDWPCLVPRLVAEAKLGLGRTDEAVEWIRRAETAAAAAGARVELARLAVVRAGLLLAGRDDASVRAGVDLVDRASREFDALGMGRFARQAQRLLDVPPDLEAATRPLRPRAVLFTDIVDSTAWNVRLGDDRWLMLLAEHNRLARRAVRRQRGVVVKTTGDGICAWFAEPHEAVECAAALQRAFVELGEAHPETPIRIRCGVAVGDVFDFDGDLAGLAVTEAARICAAATAAQIVVSDEVRRRLGRLGRRCRPLGDHVLKGLPAAVPLFAVETGRDTRLTARGR